MTKDEILAAAKTLPPDELHSLAYDLLDAAGVTLVVGLSLDDVKETIEGTDLEDATDEQILEAMGAAAERDWSNEAGQAKEYAEEELARILDEVEDP